MSGTGHARQLGAVQASASNQGGTYALLLCLARQADLEVGRLGRFSFPKGYYLYVGSAMGGLKARLGRHMAGPKSLHWHIDYLAIHAELVEAWWQAGGERLECDWASLVRRFPDAMLPAAGFGSSDCRCVSHLVHVPYWPSVKLLESDSVSTLKISHLVHMQ